jgi:hypothetical protein
MCVVYTSSNNKYKGENNEVDKKYTGIIRDWQVHTLSITKKDIEKHYPGKKLQPMIISGTVVKDNQGRWLPGFHMRTSLVKRLDRKKGEVETLNSLYKLEGEEGKDILPNLGNGIKNIFYD